MRSAKLSTEPGQLQRLGLPSLPKNMRALKITEVSDRPEVLFVLANHHPRSRILAQELAKLEALPRKRADYGVATVQFAGYALFANEVITLDDFIAKQMVIHQVASSAAKGPVDAAVLQRESGRVGARSDACASVRTTPAIR